MERVRAAIAEFQALKITGPSLGPRTLEAAADAINTLKATSHHMPLALLTLLSRRITHVEQAAKDPVEHVRVAIQEYKTLGTASMLRAYACVCGVGRER